MKVRTILIDDERKSLVTLRDKLIKFCPSIEIIAETQRPEEGLELIRTLNPELVFLDIAMPKMSGFDLLAKVTDSMFEIIFVTAFDQYAIDAINKCAIGYLLKPVANEDLILSVNRALKNIENKQVFDKNKILIENLSAIIPNKSKIAIANQEGIEFIKIEEIIRCEGEKGYTKLFLENQKPLLSSQSIGHFAKILNQVGFYLVHKSHLINGEHIKKYLNEGYVELYNNTRIPVSRNRRVDLLNCLKR